MPTWQFDSYLNSDGSVIIPQDVAAQLQPKEPVRVILSTDEETADWQKLSAEQFLAGYGSGDEIYDQLPSG
jgi:hypothetical protein